MLTCAAVSFADRVVGRCRQLGHPLCLGLDPHLERLPPLFGGGGRDPSDPATVEAVGAFLVAVLERAAPRVAAVKPQIAFFERLGWRGLRLLAELVERAWTADLPVILDAKRGDIGSTAAAYAAAYLEPASPFPADALTVSPYLGRDSLDPLLAACRKHGRGVFVLVKTSNPGSGDFQDLALRDGDRPLYAAVAAALAEPAAALAGPATGWSSLGVVVGATYPGESERIRALLPRSLFLVPGYGTQGAAATEAVRGFVPGPAGREGGLVNASRALLFPPGSDTTDATAWDRAIDEGINRATDELSAAVAG